ncbi:PRC and DUF2382 domain-containing protein [Catenuloplanes atrovinosus]|uniref:Uncharacterized protein (TIGR02271 family) n=1 Tax=Catenuloplanes atrovinosus TaxID=137266 RepID=A0AAE3YK62_9ACTN|nr:PRC and DUF2382 domain-containing protein [Catenuloplanes atrovinosus]MDR7273955.1 uncharacterized protein (TIGR02271 family) [Catenuloplanes atrovinosus]
MSITSEHWQSLPGRTVFDRDGDRVGTVGQVWTGADGTGAEWISVRTGLFGLRDTLIPLGPAELRGDELHVPFDKSTIKQAPRVENDGDEPLDQTEVQRLYSYYAGFANGGRHRGDKAMTRSEERLQVGTERQTTGKARLRKYVVTEEVRTTVPVQREEVRLEREPITDANRDDAYAGPDISEAEHEVTLHAERPVVSKEAVPVERVRLGTETVQDEETVGGRVRKERIEADLPDRRR